MSETTPNTSAAQSTIFERVWHQKDGRLFISEKHGIMAVADAFPKLPLQIVVTPRYGTPGVPVHFGELSRTMRRKLHEVSDAFEERMLEVIDLSQRVITHIEGYGVADHAHIIKFAAERQQGKDLYTGVLLGDLALAHTVEALTFEEVETDSLESRLDEIR